MVWHQCPNHDLRLSAELLAGLLVIVFSHNQLQEAGFWRFEQETILSVKNQTIRETEIARQVMEEIRALWIEAEKWQAR